MVGCRDTADDAVALAAIVLAVLLHALIVVLVLAFALVSHIPAITPLIRVAGRAPIGAASILAAIPHTTGTAEQHDAHQPQPDEFQFRLPEFAQLTL